GRRKGPVGRVPAGSSALSGRLGRARPRPHPGCTSPVERDQRRSLARSCPRPQSPLMTETPSSTTSPARPRARDPFLDNARGLLITMVVVGHTVESFHVLDQVIPDMVYTAIYSFHMAAFVAISGYLSRSYRNEPRQLKRVLSSIVAPYLIFQMVHEVAKHFLEGRNLELQLFLPAWTLWFLLALLVWRLLSPLLRSLRHPLLIAVAVAVIAPLDPDLDSTFSLGRIAGMLPFFVIGLISTPETLARIKAFRHRWLGGAIMVAALLCAL